VWQLFRKNKRKRRKKTSLEGGAPGRGGGFKRAREENKKRPNITCVINIAMCVCVLCSSFPRVALVLIGPVVPNFSSLSLSAGCSQPRRYLCLSGP
jgi:hypothetical protein